MKIKLAEIAYFDSISLHAQKPAQTPVRKKKGTSLSDPTHINHFSYSELRFLLEKYFYHVEVVGFVGRGGMEFLGKLFPGLLSFQLIFRCSKPRQGRKDEKMM